MANQQASNGVDEMEASAEDDGETKAGEVEAGQQENLPPASAKAEGDYLKHLKKFRDQSSCC